MNKIKIAIKNVGESLKLVEVEDSLEVYQNIVGGYVEMVHLEFKYIMICNENGRLMGLPVNFRLGGDTIAGNVFFTKVKEEEFESLTDLDFHYLKEWLNEMAY